MNRMSKKQAFGINEDDDNSSVRVMITSHLCRQRKPPQITNKNFSATLSTCTKRNCQLRRKER